MSGKKAAETIKHEVVWVPIDSVIPYESNAKTHPEDQIQRLMKMMAKGFDQPIVVDAQRIILKGHGRLQAAKKLGMKEVPCVIRADLTEDEVIAHRLGDNKNAESPWDMAFAIPELNYLHDQDFDMDLTGFLNWDPDKPLEKVKTYEGSQELSPDAFDKFDCKCPRCGFEFNK